MPPIRRKKRPTLTKALTAPKRISPGDIARWKNEFNKQEAKAKSVVRSNASTQMISSHIRFNNSLKKPTIKVDRPTKALTPREKTTAVVRYNIAQKERLIATAGQPRAKTNPPARTIIQQQKQSMLKYQRQGHARILRTIFPKTTIPAGRGGYPAIKIRRQKRRIK